MESNETKNLNVAEPHNDLLESIKKMEQSVSTRESGYDVDVARKIRKIGNIPYKKLYSLPDELYFSPGMVINPFYSKELEIRELKEKLYKAEKEVKEGNQEQVSQLKDKLKELEDEKKDLEQKLEDKLNKDIEDAKEALANSLNSATRRISEYRAQARLIQKYVRQLFCLDLIIILGFVLLMWLGSNTFIALFEKNAWSLIFFTFPVVMILTIAITLLRHQKKLLDEVRHYSAEKRQIELYSGLLKASQHAAAGLNDPQKSAEYVQETFTAIRNRILSEQPHSNTAASASEKEDYGLEAIVKIIADLAAKNEAKK